MRECKGGLAGLPYAAQLLWLAEEGACVQHMVCVCGR